MIAVKLDDRQAALIAHWRNVHLSKRLTSVRVNTKYHNVHALHCQLVRVDV